MLFGLLNFQLADEEHFQLRKSICSFTCRQRLMREEETSCENYELLLESAMSEKSFTNAFEDEPS